MDGNYLKFNLPNKDLEIIRTETRFFDIANCAILSDSTIVARDGLVPDAVEVSNFMVADFAAEVEERDQLLERVQTLLQEWIKVRRERSRNAKSGKVPIRKEVAK